MIKKLFLIISILLFAMPVYGAFYMPPVEDVTTGNDHYKVVCDGYVLRLSYEPTAEEETIRIYDSANSTQLGKFMHQVRVSSATYGLRFDNQKTVEVVEDTPLRKVIRFTGEFETTAQVSLDANDKITVTYYIYSDRIAAKFEWVDNADTTLDNQQSTNRINAFLDENLTNEDNIHENGAGAEADPGANADSTGDYIGCTADEINVIGIDLEHTSNSAFLQRLAGNGNVYFQWNDTTLSAGTHTMTVMWVIDAQSPDRYSSAERLEIGDSYKDQWPDETFNDAVTFYWEGDDCTSATGSTTTVGGVNCTLDDNGTFQTSGGLGNNDDYYDNVDTSSHCDFTVTNNDILDPDNFNMSFWFYLPSWVDGKRIFTYIVDSNNYIYFRTYSGDTFVLEVKAGGTEKLIYDATPDLIAVAGVWSHVRIVIDGSTTTGTFYLNGVKIATRTDLGTWSGTGGTLAIGGNSNHPDVHIDEVYITDDPDDPNLFKPTTGEWVTDQVIPDTTYYGSAGGFATDGAFHGEMSATDYEFKLTNDIDRHSPAIQLHRPMYLTGTVGAETDHLIFWNKMNSITDGHSPEVGGGTITVNNSGNLALVDGVRGQATESADGDNASFEYTNTLADETEGTIMFWASPLTDGWNVANQYMFAHDSSTSEFRMIINSGSLSTTYNSDTTPLYSLSSHIAGQWYHFMLSWFHDGTNLYRWLSINGEVVQTDIATVAEPSFAKIRILNLNDTGINNADCVMQDFIILSKALIPNSAPFVGNGDNSETSGTLDRVDTDVADENIKIYVNGLQDNGEAVDIGTGNVTATGSPDHATGVDGVANGALQCNASGEYYSFNSAPMGDTEDFLVSFWYKETGTVTTYGTFFIHSGATNRFRLTRESQDTRFGIGIDGTLNGYLNVTTNVFDGNWHHIMVRGRASDNLVEMWINGVMEDDLTATAWDTIDLSSGSLQIGTYVPDDQYHIGGAIDHFFVSDNYNLPLHPTFFGEPIHLNVMQEDSTDIQFGDTDGWHVVWTPSGWVYWSDNELAASSVLEFVSEFVAAGPGTSIPVFMYYYHQNR